jgi:hypothetical protein
MTTEERFAKLEDVMDRLAARVLALDDALVSMAESQERLADIQADQYKRTQEQFRQTDTRIDRLVSAIGELARRGA